MSGTPWPKLVVSGLQFIMFGFLVLELKFLGRDLPVSVPVLVGEHVLHDHFSIETGSQLPLACRHLGMNVLRELGRGQDKHEKRQSQA